MADAAVMAGKFVLVTGGTGGIGKATAIGLAALGARVGITGRDRARTEAAAAGIGAAPGSPAVDAFAADMSAQAGVRRLAAQVAGAYPRLDVLVNNVGGFWAHRRLTADGLERTFALNHLAPFLLTSLLLDRLTASAPARVVTVSSGAHASGRIDFDDLQGERDYSGQRAYGQSKLANVMFTYELARRLAGTGVTATACHPGVVRTSFGTEDQAAHMAAMIGVARLFMKTPAHGAATPVYLASSLEVEGVTGRYFASRKPRTLQQGLLRHCCRGPALADQRRPDRPDSNRIVHRRIHRPARLRRAVPCGRSGRVAKIDAGHEGSHTSTS
jgi:retinol dehydrogenase 14